MFTSKFQEWVRAGARRLVVRLGLVRLTPNALTMVGMAITAVGALLVAAGFLVAGGVVLLVAGLFDVLDGAVARVTGKVYRYGAFLDSTVDRYAEGFTFIALLYHFLFGTAAASHRVEAMLVIAALLGSLLVSYIRARAQSLGFACEGGFLARPERVLLILIGLVIPPLLFVVLLILAVGSNLTALQRIWFVWKQSRQTAPAE
ncbi:MAG: CDP-alcohol phosphatidyltransferase family protein [Candidatus Dormibacteria bacterium]